MMKYDEKGNRKIYVSKEFKKYREARYEIMKIEENTEERLKNMAKQKKIGDYGKKFENEVRRLILEEKSDEEIIKELSQSFPERVKEKQSVIVEELDDGTVITRLGAQLRSKRQTYEKNKARGNDDDDGR